MSLFMELFANFADAFIGVVFVVIMCKGSLRRNWLWIPAGLLCFAVSTVFLYITVFSLLQSIIITVILYLLAFSIKKPGTLLRKILSPMIFEIVLIFLSMGLNILFSLLFGDSLEQIASVASLPRFMYLIIHKITLTVLCIFIAKFLTPNRHFHVLDLVIYLFSPIQTVYILYIFMKISLDYPIETYYPPILIAVIGLLFVNIFSFLLFSRAARNEQLKHENEMLKLQKEFEQIKYHENEVMYEQIRKQRHDYKEQLLYLETLAEQGESEKLKGHIDTMREQISDEKNTVRTHNSVLDCILNSKIAMNPDITFSVIGEVVPLANIDDLQLASLFGNMLQNAIEETGKTVSKQIEVTFRVVGCFQNITCKNPLHESALINNPDLNTTKKEKELHGFGIKSMRDIVASCGGLIEFYEEDGAFCSHIALPISNTNCSL